jgi:hypothetical protein
MTVAIPDSHLDLLEKPIVTMLTTVSAQAEPYAVAVWKRWDGQHLFITSDAGNRKHRNIIANPNVAVMMLDPANANRYLSLGGIVEEIIATAVVEELDRQALAFTGNRHYFGALEPIENLAGFDGVYFKIRPTRAVTFG